MFVFLVSYIIVVDPRSKLTFVHVDEAGDEDVNSALLAHLCDDCFLSILGIAIEAVELTILILREHSWITNC